MKPAVQHGHARGREAKVDARRRAAPRHGHEAAPDRPIRPAREKVYGRIGSLQVQLARSRNDIRRPAAALRVFYEEMSAVPSLTAQMRRRTRTTSTTRSAITCSSSTRARRQWDLWKRTPAGGRRHLSRSAPEGRGAAARLLYAAQYDVAPLLPAHARHRFMELGRSCVLKPYRNRRSVELLWHGLWTTCASTGGRDARMCEFRRHRREQPPRR
jgi:hypothetical protein